MSNEKALRKCEACLDNANKSFGWNDNSKIFNRKKPLIWVKSKIAKIEQLKCQRDWHAALNYFNIKEEMASNSPSNFFNYLRVFFFASYETREISLKLYQKASGRKSIKLSHRGLNWKFMAIEHLNRTTRWRSRAASQCKNFRKNYEKPIEQIGCL